MPTFGTIARFFSSTAGENTLLADITNAQTSFSLSAAPTGFPTSYPFTIAVGYGTTNEELMDVSSVAGPSLVVTRGVDGTSALSHSAGEKVRHIASARDFRETQEHIATIAGGHGITGSFVGTTDTQTLTNKTLTTPVIGDYSAATHDHSPAVGGGNIPQSSVTNLTTDLAGKSSTGHSHVQSDVSGLVADITALEAFDVTADSRLDSLEAADVTLDSRLDALEAGRLFAYKPTDETIVSNDTFQNDDDLFVTLPAATRRYTWTMVLHLDGSSAHDAKIQMTLPGGVTVRASLIRLPAGATDETGLQIGPWSGGSATIGLLGAGTVSTVQVSGIVRTTGTGGTMRLQWAQNASNATDLNMGQNSFMKLIEEP